MEFVYSGVRPVVLLKLRNRRKGGFIDETYC